MARVTCFLCFIFLQSVAASYTSNVYLIRDYFVFKNVTNVVGFSCGEILKDCEMTKMLNNAGIAVSLKSLKSWTDISRFLQAEYWTLGVFLDMQCSTTDENIMKLFYETSSHHMFEHLHQWLIIGDSLNKTVELIDDRTFSILTDLIVAVPRDNDYDMYDVYNHCKPCGGLLNITRFGTWTEQEGLNVTLSLDKFSRRWNYNKMNVRVAGVLAAKPKDRELVDYLQEGTNVRVDNWSKFGYAIMAHVGELFNFSFQVIELNHWAKNDSNGPLMGGLKNGVFEMGYFPSILTNERLNLANVIVQVWPVRTCFMFLTLPSFKGDMNIIFRPFAKTVWYMVILLAFLTALALWIISKVEKDTADSDCGTTILIAIAAICQQGLPFFGNQFASRVAFLQTMIFGLLIYNCYSAAIVSSRLNAPLNKMNDSLYSLLKSRMKLAAHKDIYFNILLRSPAEEVQYFRTHWETIPDENKFYPIEDGIKRITKPGFAYHADPINAYPLIERIFDKQMICQLTEVHLLRPASLGLWSTKHSPFQEITKIGLIRIATSGIRKREALRWSYRKPYCNKDKHYVSSVTIYETIPIILVLLFGIILSSVLCFIEYVTFHLLRKREMTKKSIIRVKGKMY